MHSECVGDAALRALYNCFEVATSSKGAEIGAGNSFSAALPRCAVLNQNLKFVRLHSKRGGISKG
jgi:hypothetical protein